VSLDIHDDATAQAADLVQEERIVHGTDQCTA
jgi:hypothetical protein